MISVKGTLEKLLTRSPLMVRIALLLEKLATEVYKLGQNVVELNQTVEAQQELMQLLYARQNMIMKALEDRSLDMKLPMTKQEKVSKPN